MVGEELVSISPKNFDTLQGLKTIYGILKVNNKLNTI